MPSTRVYCAAVVCRAVCVVTDNPARVQVLRCCLENATSVARTFLMADCIVTEIPELEDPAAAGAPGGMGDMGGY